MTNQVPPPPVDNDPKPNTDAAQKAQAAWLGSGTWSSMKTWFYTVYRALRGIKYDDASGMTSINGLPVWDADVPASSNGVQFPGLAPYTPGNITGQTPPNGAVGQIISASFSGVNLPNNTTTTCTSISIPPGYWLVWCTGLINNTMTAMGNAAVSTSNGPTNGYAQLLSGSAFATVGLSVAPYAFATNTFLTVSVQCYSGFSAGSSSAGGFIAAMRIG